MNRRNVLLAAAALAVPVPSLVLARELPHIEFCEMVDGCFRLVKTFVSPEQYALYQIKVRSQDGTDMKGHRWLTRYDEQRVAITKRCVALGGHVWNGRERGWCVVCLTSPALLAEEADEGRA